MARRGWVLLGLALIGVTVAGFVAAGAVSPHGRTPPSGVVDDAVGHDTVVFDRSYESTGSREDKSRVVVVATERSPSDALQAISAGGGWRSVGQGIERQSDGLCVVAYDAGDYLALPNRNHEALEAVRTHPQSVALSLLYG